MRPGPIATGNINSNDADHVLKHKKKRGVYVEKKLSKLSAHSRASSRNKNQARSPLKCHPRMSSPKKQPAVIAPPRPPPTSFVNSVLNILSKTTTQSQYLQPNEIEIRVEKDITIKPQLENVPEVKKNNPKDKKKNKMNNRSRKFFELHPDKGHKSSSNNTARSKYKSNVLSNYNKNNRKDDVLYPPNKQAPHSPSLLSSSGSQDGLSWMDYMDENDEVFINKESTYSHQSPVEINYETNQVVKEINEGKKLMEEISKHDDKSEKGPDKAIYNFFVDVLQTIKPDYQIQELNRSCSLKESSDELERLEIDENVAKKLAFTEKRDTKKVSIYGLEDDELSDSPAEHYDIENPLPKRPIIIPEPIGRPRRKSRSFAYTKPKPLPQTSSSFRGPPTSNTAKSKKKRFMAMLRQQLISSIDYEPQQPEEPQSLFEALKLMSKNKAAPQRVRFQELRYTRRPIKGTRPGMNRKTREKKENDAGNYDVRYPIEAEVDSRNITNIYGSPGGSLRSLQVYGEDYINHKGVEDYEVESNTTDLCNRFSIASFLGDQSSKNIKAKSSPMSVSRRTIGNRSTSPFSGRSSKF